MNKIINVNLGGYPFTIDEDAYAHLNGYLETIHAHFKKSEGYDEITGDIESRMAELFSEKLRGSKIISLQSVKDVIKVMGTPEDFGATPIHEDMGADTLYGSSEYRTGKRFFRDSEDKIVGGVASGMSAYFGIKDPLWLRLGFLILFLSGFGFLVYIVLWVLAPETASAADRLAMRGEPINITNIAKTVEEEIEGVGERLSYLTNKFDGKKKPRRERMNFDFSYRKGSHF